MTTRLTARGRVVAAVLACVAVLAVLAGLITVAVRWGTGPDCTVTVGARQVSLSSEQADRAALASRRADPRSAVARAADLSSADARAVTRALLGLEKGALSCRHGGTAKPEPDRLNAAGLTGRAQRVRVEMARDFPRAPTGGYQRGGVTTGHMPGSAHYEGRAVDVFFRPITARNQQRGWALAAYLVARAKALQIETVIFDDRIWTARRASQGWRDYRVDTTGRPAAVARILEHLDHVHVDVAD